MKKWLSILLALTLLLSLVSLAAAGEAAEVPAEVAAEETAEEWEEFPAIPEEAEGYPGKWVDEGGSVTVYEQDGGFDVIVSLYNEDGRTGDSWEYLCVYDPDLKMLVGFNGTRWPLSFDEENGHYVMGDAIGSDDYSAVFRILENGRLGWAEMKDNYGRGRTFEPIGIFDGTVWACDRASIEFCWEEEGYKVEVKWADSAMKQTVWDYSCYYQADTGSVAGFGIKYVEEYDENGEVVSSEEIYTDGEVEFVLDEDGKLIWKDQKEDAGNGMLFEFMAI